MTSSTPEFLDVQLLAELEAHWRRAGADTAEGMEPGLDDAEIDRITAPLGFVVPEEVRRLFRWHSSSGLRDFVARRGLVDLASSVEETLEFREEDERFDSRWLKMMDEKPYVIFDCSGAFDAPVPVWHYDYEFDFPTRPLFASIGEMFRFWVELLDEGLMYWAAPGWRMRRPLPDDINEKLGGVPSD